MLEQRIVNRDGRWLCSPRDPVKEADDWLRRQKIYAADRAAVVLGGGACHHLLNLLQAYPQMQFRVVELDQETQVAAEKYLRSQATETLRVQWLSKSQAEQLSCRDYDIVLNFRPAWAGFEGHYMELYFRLTQNSASSLARAAAENKLPLTSQILREKTSQVDFALKDLDFVESEAAVDEVKFWRTLRELVD